MPHQPMSYSAAMLALHALAIRVSPLDQDRLAAVALRPLDAEDDHAPTPPAALRLDRAGVIALAQALQSAAPDEIPAVRALLAAGWAVRRDDGAWTARHPSGDDVIFDDAAALIQLADLVAAAPDQPLADLLALVPPEPPANLLTDSLREAARRFVQHRRQSGRELLEACRWLAEARAEATEGQWGTWLAATKTTPDTAERLLSIHRLALASEAFARAFETDWIGERAAAQLGRAITGPRAVSPGLLDYVLSQPQPPPTRQLDAMIRRAAESPTLPTIPHTADAIPDHVLASLSRCGWDSSGRSPARNGAPKQRGSVPLFRFRHAGTGEEREVGAAEAAVWAEEEAAAAERRAQHRAAFTAIRDRFAARGWELETATPHQGPPYRLTSGGGGAPLTVRSWEALEARLRVLEAPAHAGATSATSAPTAEVIPAAAVGAPAVSDQVRERVIVDTVAHLTATAGADRDAALAAWWEVGERLAGGRAALVTIIRARMGERSG